MNNWSKRKFYIRINCWLIMLILLAVLLLMGFPIISNAEGESDSPSPSPTPTPSPSVPIPEGYTSLGTLYNITQSNVYTPDNTIELPEGAMNPLEWNSNSAFNYNLFDNDLSNGEFIISDTELLREFYNPYQYTSFTYENFPYYFINYNGLGFDVYLTMSGYVPEYNFSRYACTATKIQPYGSDDSMNQSLTMHTDRIYEGYDNVYVMTFYDLQYPSVHSYGTVVDNHYSDYCYYFGFEYFGLLASNVPTIFTIIPQERNGGTELFIQNDSSITSDIIGAPHYQILHGSSEPDEPTVFPDGSGGDDSNNLYMRTADWRFNIPSYWGNVTSVAVQPKYENSWGSGSILFYGLLNDYQKANASNFNLDFKFHIWCSGHYFSDVNSEINGNFYGSFDFTDQVSLTNFINNNNSCSFSVDDIFEYAENSAGNSFNDFLDSDVKGHNSIDNWNWYITCDACLSASSGSSGHITEKYNFISQVSEETNNNITDNDNPYIPDDGSTPNTDNNQAPSNNDGYSKNGININNNPVITITNTNNNNSSAMNEVNNGNGNPFNILIDKLFGNGTVQEGSIGGTTQNQLLQNTGASRWLAVMGDSMSWVPASLWLEIQLFLFISLGILVVAFILRIILDFL